MTRRNIIGVRQECNMTEHLRVDTKGDSPRYFIGEREVTKAEYLDAATRITGNA